MKSFRSKPIRLAAALAACALVPATGLMAQSDSSPPRAVTVTANPPQPVTRVSVRSAPSCAGLVAGPETNSCGASSACSGAVPGPETNSCGGPSDCSGPSPGPDANDCGAPSDGTGSADDCSGGRAATGSCGGLRDARGSLDDCSAPSPAAAPAGPAPGPVPFPPAYDPTVPAPQPRTTFLSCAYHCQCEASPVEDRDERRLPRYVISPQDPQRR